MRKIIATAILAASLAGFSACDGGNPCDAQPNPDKQTVCKGEK